MDVENPVSIRRVPVCYWSFQRLVSRESSSGYAIAGHQMQRVWVSYNEEDIRVDMTNVTNAPYYTPLWRNYLDQFDRVVSRRSGFTDVLDPVNWILFHALPYWFVL